MSPAEYVVVGEFRNDTKGEMRIFLEMMCEEIYLLPGHSAQLIARPSNDLLPITVDYISDGLHIFAARAMDPDWYIKFKGVILKPGYSTRLSDLELPNAEAFGIRRI